MNGKKVTVILVGVILLACIAVFVAFQIFFKTYEPQTIDSFDEQSISSVINEAS